LKITPDFISTAEGSVLIELGKTRVICTASVNDGVPGFLKGAGKGWVTANMECCRALRERTAREAAARETVRPHAGNSTADREVAARHHRPGKCWVNAPSGSIAT